MKKLFFASVLFLALLTGRADAFQQGLIFIDIQRVWADPQYIHMGIMACAADSTGTPAPYCTGLGDIQLDIAQPAEGTAWKDAIANAFVLEANEPENGFSLTAGDVIIHSFEPGDYRSEIRGPTWTKDATKTNVGTAFVNIYPGYAGEAQGVNFLGYKQYRMIINVNKIGTGTQTAALVDVLNTANFISIDDTQAAGEHLLDTGWLNLPAWATRIFALKPQAKSTVGLDDPVYRQFALYLR